MLDSAAGFDDADLRQLPRSACGKRAFTPGRAEVKILLLVALIAAALLVIANRQPVRAQDGGSPMHPVFPLLDESGASVLESGQPVSTMQTCGGCHDTTFIAEHSVHANSVGTWDPITYAALSSTSARIAGSAEVEMNCFLCHLTAPNNPARVERLEAGEFQWANTATLLGSGIVEQGDDGALTWNPAAFDADGSLREDYVTIQDPSDANCGQCHGLTHADVRTPLTLDACATDQWSTITTGQVFSPQVLSETGLNFEDKESLCALVGCPRRARGRMYRLPLFAEQPGLLPGSRAGSPGSHPV